jgi:hypothetical protein
MEDRAGESVVCLGVIGVSSAIVRQAKAVNAAKAELRAICSPLQRVRQAKLQLQPFLESLPVYRYGRSV